jgi:hypothetical protein
VQTFQVHIEEVRLGRGGLGLLNDDNGFLSLNYVAVDLWRVGGDHLLRLLLVLFNDLDSTVRSGLHLHTIYLGGDSLDLWLSGLLNGWLRLLALSVEVVFILQTTLVSGQNEAICTHSSPFGEPLELPLQLGEDRSQPPLQQRDHPLVILFLHGQFRLSQSPRLDRRCNRQFLQHPSPALDAVRELIGWPACVSEDRGKELVTLFDGGFHDFDPIVLRRAEPGTNIARKTLELPIDHGKK